MDARRLDAEAELRKYIREIPDFPAPGVLFRDLTPLLADAGALKLAIQAIAGPFMDAQIDYVVGTEARQLPTPIQCAGPSENPRS